VGSVDRDIRVGMDGDPDDGGIEGPVLCVLSMGDSEKVGGIDGVAPLDGGADQVVNEGINSVPHLVE